MAEKQNKTAVSEKVGAELVASESSTGSLSLSLIADLRKIIEQGRREAYAAVSQVMISTYWNIGKRIVEEEQGGADYAKYGQYLLRDLGEQLCAEYGRGYTKRRLEEYRLFYLSFRNIEIAQTRLCNLTWSHFRIIMREPTPEGRAWYVRIYDDLFKGADDNPTIGVLLCTDTDNTIARYSVLHENEQLFAAKYMAYLPTEKEWRHEIEQQKILSGATS